MNYPSFSEVAMLPNALIRRRKINTNTMPSLWVIMVFLFLSAIMLPQTTFAQRKKDVAKVDTLKSGDFSGLKFRSIGPAFASGRIADFAVNPKHPEEYYVAVASGHIWKTTTSGTTWESIFDNYGAYSIGCLAMDPGNSNVLWAGTGENNHQRCLGYGDGVYKTMDGGKSWKNMGLKNSRQIGMIAIDPRNSDVVYVAAEGSAWGPGGDRGLYKTTDGGKTWNKVLNISDDTGVNNVIMDSRNPDVLPFRRLIPMLFMPSLKLKEKPEDFSAPLTAALPGRK